MIANIGNISYPLFIEKGALDTVGERIADKFPSSKIVIITDDKVFSLYGKRVEDSIKARGLEVNSIILGQGESTKSLAVLEHVFDKLIEYETTRTDVITALGGGVIGDLAGFAASCYLRGIKYVQIPTTLLAQVDSSIGGKTAVNLKQGKNLAGAFYHPSMVIIDSDASETLDDENFACGMAEVIKYAFIMDKDLYGMLTKYNSRSKIQPVLSDVIKACCEDKLKVVQQDEKDNGLRLTLNFGHTLGHALEKNQELNLSHGHAVAIGMAVFTKNSEKLGQTKQGTYEQVVSLLRSFDLPVNMPAVDMQKTLEYAKRDKKTFNSTLKLVLIEEVGKCFIYPIDYEEIHKYIRE